MSRELAPHAGRVMTLPAVSELALFAGCRRSQLARIERLLTLVRLPIGCEVLTAGNVAREFAIVAEGEVAVVDGRGREIAVLGPGEIIGELGLLRDEPIGATVTTLTPVITYVGNRREFFSLLDIAPAIQLRVLSTAVRRLAAS
jgi:CRP/FNR family transcriptional regulator, cyclic AMP receptor protein